MDEERQKIPIAMNSTNKFLKKKKGFNSIKSMY